ncbi:GNAT family N-acetyltransferase [Arthrobacter sp. Z1-15]
MAKTFVLLGDERSEPRPLAGSGYDVWKDHLAHMGVLTADGSRRQGHAATAVSIAVDHATRAGLIPQWRVRTDNTASIRTALRAGFAHAGSQTTVLLGP